MPTGKLRPAWLVVSRMRNKKNFEQFQDIAKEYCVVKFRAVKKSIPPCKFATECFRG